MKRADEISASCNLFLNVTEGENIERIAWILQDISMTLARILDVMEGNDDEEKCGE